MVRIGERKKMRMTPNLSPWQLEDQEDHAFKLRLVRFWEEQVWEKVRVYVRRVKCDPANTSHRDLLPRDIFPKAGSRIY